MSSFDFDATFGDDYVHFYLPILGEDRNRDDARQIVESLGLIAGERVLDAPCGHGRISNVLALQGMEVCAIDKMASFIDRARLNAEQLGATVEYRIGDIAELRPDLDGTFDAASNWFTSFGYHDDEACQAILAGLPTRAETRRSPPDRNAASRLDRAQPLPSSIGFCGAVR